MFLRIRRKAFPLVDLIFKFHLWLSIALILGSLRPEERRSTSDDEYYQTIPEMKMMVRLRKLEAI